MFSIVLRDGVQPDAGEHVLLTVDRQVISELVDEDLGRDRRVVLVAFDDPGRTLGGSDAALRLILASVLRVLADFDDTSSEERKPVFPGRPTSIREVAFFAVRFALFVGIVDVHDDFFARQVSR